MQKNNFLECEDSNDMPGESFYVEEKKDSRDKILNILLYLLIFIPIAAFIGLIVFIFNMGNL